MQDSGNMTHRRKKKMGGTFNKKVESWSVITVCMLLFGLFVLILSIEGTGWCQGWHDIKIRLLPDNCFAEIESDSGTKMRHCPHHDENGRLDEEQLIYVLGTLDQETWLATKHKKDAKKHLLKHYDRFRTKILKKELKGPVDINRARLTELVALPQVGPSLAVKIIEYRNAHGMFITIEKIKKVGGIGPGNFNAIRHYISTY